MKVAVVLFNLGGPDSPEAIEPFLRNLFSDSAVIPLPRLLRLPLARFIAKRRSPVAHEIFRKIGGRSPILAETEKQALALDAALTTRGVEARSFIAMRAWKPFALAAAQEIRTWGAGRVVLLPLYPQFSTTTTASSLKDWRAAAALGGLTVPQSCICCYPWEDGFVGALADLIRTATLSRKTSVDYRLLLSAHGLPKRVIGKGDPYQWQVEKTAQAIVDRLGIAGLDWSLCYQSRVGPVEWIGPGTDEEIRRAGRDGNGVIVAPIAFVSEHSETLVELDMDYANLATECRVSDYIRVPAVGSHPLFIEGLANMVQRALDSEDLVTCGPGRICPAALSRCGFGNADG